MSLFPYYNCPYYYGYPYPGYPYYGLFNDYKINGLLNEYDELNQLAIQNNDIYLQNMLDDVHDCNGCSRDISGNIIPCVLPPIDLSNNIMRNREYNNQPEFPMPPHLYPPYNPPFHHPPFYPPYNPPFHHPPFYPPPFHHPPYNPPFHHPPYNPPYYPYPYMYKQ